MLTLSCALSSITAQTTATLLQETPEALTTVTLGLPAYTATTFPYTSAAGARYTVQISDPILIAEATKPQKWGYFQFPTIGQNTSGTIWAQWNLAPDSIKSYGKAQHGQAISQDGGHTWTTSADSISTQGGVLLPNGDRLNIRTPAPIKLADLTLPPPVGKSQDNYAHKPMDLYRLSDLPSPLNGVPLERLTSGALHWLPETAELDDPQVLRYSFLDLFPVVWWGDMHLLVDGSLMAAVYPGYHQQADGTVTQQYGVFFYRSTDEGKSWQIQGRIPYAGSSAADPKAAQRMGFSEPGFAVLVDGTFFCVMRTTDGSGPGPMYASSSADHGKTWSTPAPITGYGVLPRLLQLDSGITVLASGRPGVQLRFTTSPRTNRYTQALQLLPFDLANLKDEVSCGYTNLLQTGPETFLIIYSDFKHHNKAGEIRKAIKVREVTIQPAS